MRIVNEPSKSEFKIGMAEFLTAENTIRLETGVHKDWDEKS